MSTNEAAVLRGEARPAGGVATAATVTLGPAGFSVAVGGTAPWEAAYRDVATVAVDESAALVQLGAPEAGERWVFERFGPRLGTLARGIRDGRFRQWLSDGLVEISDDEPVELVELDAGSGAGVGQLLYHRRGVALAPIDERLPRRRVRRADIGSVTASPESGGVRIETPGEPIELHRLGQAATSHALRWSALRDSAAADISAIVAALVPDAPFEVRRRLAAALREGHPADAASLGAGWDALEQAVLTEPTFADSYRALLAKGAGPAAIRWLAIAPEEPGFPDRVRAWFFVGLPGNLVAMELVTEGAHATYLFRVSPRATFEAGPAHDAALRAAVEEISEALIDARFLREPMAIPDARLAEARFLRYRLALRALPSLAAARARFVARLVHRDPVSWAAALDDLIGWHGSVRDEAAIWPGRSAQESQIDEAETGVEGPPEG
jgi:hypothetical protein